ncbi:hypothetical protein OW763_04195 [Clostridium aestuarii]|uniref:Uncharacterized protein n=1 Tax=Clostridium aestuarii TaxID=338193 RepID=A0ABT4CXH8_9CLOT|nr:hypothetical protein [Clostridium aestuarii]MCY6483552.1 hypothetical protein [Clostridium aestuarii]
MDIYSKPSEKLLEKIKNYLEKDETESVSKEFLYEGKMYRQVIITKKNVKRINTEFLYIDEDENVIDDIEIKKQLSRLSYYLDVFFNDKSDLNIKKALKSEEIKNREIKDLEDVSQSLDVLYKENIEEAKKVRNITNHMIELIKKHNEKIEDVNLKADNYIKKGEVFRDEIITPLYNIYEEGILLNLDKAKLLVQGKTEYDIVKKIVSKKMVFKLFNKRVRKSFTKIIYTMEYYKRLVNRYEKALDMSMEQYKDYIKESHENQIENRVKLIRNK